MTKQQARQLISTNVPDPDNEMYYRRTSAMKVWERSINNMGVCLNYLNEREKVPYEGIMSMMMQLQKCQLSIVNNDFTIVSQEEAFYFGQLISEVCRCAIDAAGCKDVVISCFELFDIVIKAMEEPAKNDPTIRAMYDMLRNRVKPSFERDLDEKCKEAFMNLAEGMLAPDECPSSSGKV